MNPLPSGVDLFFNINREVVRPPANGFMGNLRPSDQLEMCIQINRRSLIFGYHVDGKRHLVEKLDQGPKLGISDRFYRSSIQIKMGEPDPETGNGAVAHTEYPMNNIRLLEISADFKGGFALWTVALISQKGQFYATIQRVFEGRAFLEDGKVVVPRFDGRSRHHPWPELVDHTVGLFETDTSRLSDVSEWEDEPEAPGTFSEEGKGKVIYFSLSEMTGAIATDQGAAKVHWKNLRSDRLPNVLFADEIVSFDGLREPRTTKTRPTSFALEAVGVRPLNS